MYDYKIGFIGAGNMTKSLVTGLVRSGFEPTNIIASNPSANKRDALSTQCGIHTTADNNQVAAFADVIVLAVKPQLMHEVLSHLCPGSINQDKVLLSIAAGININRLSEMFPAAVKWVRCMPNTPSAVGLGMTGLCDRGVLNTDERLKCEHLMKAVGEVLWVKEEAMLDGIIAAAGSAPAYFFLFLEAMQSEAIHMGFSESEARLLVQQAMLGAATMVTSHPDTALNTLREQVTSKGGTTAQAVDTFKQGGLHKLVSKAMQAAVARAQQMSSQI